ncbi:hypothetical protein PFISCL1PPCAC_25485, partial [Pristionchus fissidentatus]
LYLRMKFRVSMSPSIWLLLLCSIAIPIGNCQIVDGGIEQEDTVPLERSPIDEDLEYSTNAPYVAEDQQQEYNGTLSEANSTSINIEDELTTAE